jgi:hypothetical protein
MKVIPVILFLLLLFILVCLTAPWLGTDTSDARTEEAHPESGWFPPLIPH